MQKRRKMSPVMPALLLMPLLAAGGGDFANPLAEWLRRGVLSAGESSEEPACFTPRDRQIRWNNVLRTNQPCPVYESWRTRPAADPAERHRLKMVFTKPVTIGTLLNFDSDAPAAEFRVTPGHSSGTGAVVTTFDEPVREIVFEGEKLAPSVVLNWGSRKELSAPLSSYQLSLLGIYALPEKRVNLAAAAEARVSGVGTVREADRPYNSGAGLIDGTTRGFWKSPRLAAGEAAAVELTLPQPVVLREIALYIGQNVFGSLPGRVEVSAAGADGAFRELGVFDSFNAHPHNGSHFYLLANPRLEEKIGRLRLRVFPAAGKTDAALTEVLLLAAPEDNPAVAKKAAPEFAKVLERKLPGKVFAGALIADEQGRPVRALTPQEDPEGVFRFRWDGTDDDGRIVPPGRYRLLGAARSALRAGYESTPYSPAATPWVTPSRRGGWLSDHAAPTALEMVGDRIFVGAPFAEAGDTIMELDRDGGKRWGVRWFNLAGASVLRAFNGKLYVGSGGGWVGPKTVVTEFDPATRDFKTLLKRDFPPELTRGKKSFHERILTGFAPSSGELALAYAALDRIEIFDFQGKKLRELRVKAPGALRFTPDGALLAISGTRLVRLNPQTGAVEEEIVAGLAEPRDFAVLDDGYLVADAGANLVKRFDRRGNPVRSYGSGRPHRAGKFDPSSINAPNAALLDGSGRLWVAESGVMPKRISVWDARSGRFLRDYLGPARYEAGSWLDPQDVNTFYAEGMTFRRDANGKWNLANIYFDDENPTSRLLLAGKMLPERPFVLRNRRFIARDRHWTAPVLWFGELNDAGVLRPHAALGRYSLIEKEFDERPGNYSGKSGEYSFLWNDLNGNGRMEWDELAFDRGEFSVLEWNSRFGDGLEFYFLRNRREICKLSPVWRDGLPRYDWKALRKICELPPNTRIVAVAPLGSDRVLLNTRPKLRCVDQNSGRELWSYPNPYPSNQHDSPLPNPGDIQHTLNIEGTVDVPGFGPVFLLNGNKGVRHLFSFDGIYLGRLFADQRLAAPLAFDNPQPGQDLSGFSLMDEAFCGTFERGADGAVRFSGGKNHHTISRIEGLESLQRFRSDFEFTPSEYAAAAAARTARLESRNSRLREPLKIRELSAVPRFRGNPADWAAVPATHFEEGGRKLYTVRLALTPEALAGAIEVYDDSPFVNGGDDWKMLFKSGDSINFEFGSGRAKTPQPGDVRLLIAPYRGKPAAVLYQYRLASGADPVEFTSPIGKVRVDAVRRLEHLQAKVTPRRGGYLLEFSIPRAELPVLARRPLYGDFGVIYSDDAGSVNRYNAFYHGTGRGVTADVPSEIRLTPSEWRAFEIVP